MPPVHFDPIRGGFTTSKGKGSIAGQASSRAAYLRERWGIIKEVSPCYPCRRDEEMTYDRLY